MIKDNWWLNRFEGHSKAKTKNFQIFFWYMNYNINNN